MMKKNKIKINVLLIVACLFLAFASILYYTDYRNYNDYSYILLEMHGQKGICDKFNLSLIDNHCYDTDTYTYYNEPLVKHEIISCPFGKFATVISINEHLEPTLAEQSQLFLEGNCDYLGSKIYPNEKYIGINQWQVYN